MNEYRQAFEKALKEDPYDIATRNAYTDWLYEQGLDAEAIEQQRRTTHKWIEADKWLHWLCDTYNPQPDHPYEIYRITYERLIDLGLQACIEAERLTKTDPNEWFGFTCHNNEDMCDALRGNLVLFWKNWSIVTGISLPDSVNIENQAHFSCSC